MTKEARRIEQNEWMRNWRRKNPDKVRLIAAKSHAKNKEKNSKKHNEWLSKKGRLYTIWNLMKQRCYQPNSHAFECYGGRGISVCDEWRDSFESFSNWSLENGYSDSLSIDRIDVNGNYEPSNCRWTTSKVQCENKRTNFLVMYKGKLCPLSKVVAGEKTVRESKNYTMIWKRLKRGWSIDDALLVPPNDKFNKKA